MWDGPTLTVEEANRSTTCAVMIESARLFRTSRRSRRLMESVNCLSGPTTSRSPSAPPWRRCSMTRSQALLRGSCRPRRRTVARWGLRRNLRLADQARERGISCIAVADLGHAVRALGQPSVRHRTPTDETQRNPAVAGASPMLGLSLSRSGGDFIARRGIGSSCARRRSPRCDGPGSRARAPAGTRRGTNELDVGPRAL